MELPIFGRWCMYFAVTFAVVPRCGAQTRAAIPCPRGFFGSPYCRGICHCLSGADYCRLEDGRCTDGKCSLGWMNSPACQTACPYGMFGYNCSLLCHCPANDACNSISGLCSSHRCELGWGGPSCQKLLPVLVNPPDIAATKGTQITLSWPKWITGQTGHGEGNVISHTLQQIDNVTNSWQDVVNLQDSSALMKFTYTVVNLRPNTAYKYRVQLVMDNRGKPLSSVPGPESSRWIVTSCDAPSDAPTNVTAAMIENEKTYIRVAWMPPSLESMNCNGLARHEIIVSCIRPCVNLMVSEEWPAIVGIVQYFRYTNYTIKITVRAINDASIAGPLSEPFYIVLSSEASTGVRGYPADAALVLASVDQSVTTDITSSITANENEVVTTDTVAADVTSDMSSEAGSDVRGYAADAALVLPSVDMTTDITLNITPNENEVVTTDTVAADVTSDMSSETSEGVSYYAADAALILTSVDQSVATDITLSITANENEVVTTDTAAAYVNPDMSSEAGSGVSGYAADAALILASVDQSVARDITSSITANETADVTTSFTKFVTDRISHMVETVTTGVTKGLMASKRLDEPAEHVVFLKAAALQESETSGVVVVTTSESIMSSATQSGRVSAENEGSRQSQESSGTPIGTKMQSTSFNLSDISISRSDIHIVIEQHFMKNNSTPYDQCEIEVQYFESDVSSVPPPVGERSCSADGNIYIYDLLPATQYNITVTMRDINGTIRIQYSVVQFTGPDASYPPTLVITAASNTSITVKFSPRKRSANILTQRLVVTEKLRSNERHLSHFQELIKNFTYQLEDIRAFPKPQHILFNATSAEQLNLPFYVTGLVDSDVGSFVVGDGQTYEGFSYPASVSCNYNNVPLVPNSSYMVWLVWENVFDGMSYRMASASVGPVLTVEGVDFTSTVTSSSTPTPSPSRTPKADGSDKNALLINSRTEQSVILELRNIDKITGESGEITIDDVDAGSRVSSPLVNKVCKTSCFYDIRRLRPATRYKVTVQLSNSGVQRQYSIVLCTAPPPPPSPPTPVVSEISATGFTVTLATKKRSAITDLQRVVVIEKVESSNSNFQNAVTSEPTFLFEDSRSTVQQKHIMVNVATSEQLGSSFYVAGIIDSNGRTFIVGNGQTYKGVCDPAVTSCTYSSVPLEPVSSYLVWFVWENSLDGITRRMASQAAGPVQTLSASESRDEPNPDPSASLNSTSTPNPDDESGLGLSGLAIFLIVLCVLLLCIIFLVILIVWFWKRAEENRQTMVEIVHAPYKYPEPSSVNRELAVSYLNSLLISKNAPKDVEASISGGDDRDYNIPDACFIEECASSHSRSFPVPVEKFPDFCSEYLFLDTRCFLEHQFLRLPNCLTDSVNVAMLNCNAIHNRSAQVVPYDRNRVKLEHALPLSTKYVNASFVRTIGRRYCIVTQCPTLSTLGHFWQMVWERRTSTIVMLMDSEAPDSLDFDCYWPEIPGRYHAYDSIHVELVSVSTFANYCVRHFKIGELNAVRERHVFHWQYMSWSKGGVPEHPIPFLSFMKRIREERKSDSGFLVHCRTGGGRSGVYIAIDTLLTQGYNTEVVDVLRLVTLLHTERSNLVKSFVQYRFIYECLCEAFDHNPSRYLAERFVMTYQGLETSESGLKALTNEQQGLVQLPIYPNLLTSSLVSRKSIQSEACMSDPNFVFSGFIRRDMFIASRSLSATYHDEFWHRITDNRVNCIVMLNKMADLPDAEHLLPQMGQSLNSRHFSVFCASVKASASNVSVAYNLKVRLRHLSDEVGAYNVRLFEFTKWPSDDEVPAVDVMLELLEQLRKWLNRYSSNRPILLFSACGSGKSRAALLMVLWYVLEQSENEGVLDIFSTSRLIRSYIVSSMEHRDHYHFMYLAVRDYWKSNLVYYTVPVESRDQQPSTYRPGWKPPIKRHSTSRSRTISRQGQSTTGELPPEMSGESPKPRLEGQPRADPLSRILYKTDLEETEKDSVALTYKGNDISGMSADPSQAETYSSESVDVETPAKQTDVRLGFAFPRPGDSSVAPKP